MAILEFPKLEDNLPELPDGVDRAMDVAILVLWWTYIPILAKYLFSLFLAFSLTLCSALRSWSQWTPHWPDNPPRVTVIIPAYNEEVGIAKTIKSVINTKYPNLEIIVANDGSTDKTHERIMTFIRKFKKSNREWEKQNGYAPPDAATIKYMKLVNGGKANAMNHAIKAVDETSEFVMTLDADSVMHHDYIRQMMDTFELYPQAGAVAGNVLVANRSRLIGVIQQVEYVTGFFSKRADSVMNAVYIIGGAAAAYRTWVLDEVGKFDHSIITEDIELSTRILACGIPTKYAHNAVVYTEGPSDWMGLMNQRLRWKFGRFLTFLKHRSLFFSITNSNMYFCWVMLPVSVHMEVFLFFAPWLIVPFCLFYALYRNPVIFVYVLGGLCVVVLLEILVDKHRCFHINLLFLAPLNWIAATLIELVEWTALLRSIRRLMTGAGLQWQKWDRKGLAVDVGSEVDGLESVASDIVSVISTGNPPPAPGSPRSGPRSPYRSRGPGSLPSVPEVDNDTRSRLGGVSDDLSSGHPLALSRVSGLSQIEYHYSFGRLEESEEDEADENDEEESVWWYALPKAHSFAVV